MKSSDYKQLKVWQKAMDLTIEIYNLVKLLPKEETYALSDQMRRAVVSIPSNIAEGQGRNSDKEFINFLSVARGSLWELETQIEICGRLGYIDENKKAITYLMTTEVSKMLNALSNSLTTKSLTPNV
ncbi:MAG: four helix bundle protein [Bacteroidaceae bacterium]|nr:four helix bundle protein [Bacteroidaceae bacterium]